MSATALDKALLEAKVSEETAEKAVEGLAVAHDVATKTDVAELRTELKTDIAELEVRLVKWNIATNVATAGLIIAAVGLMIKLL